MPKSGINYMFAPDQMLSLPSWRFVLHFTVTPAFHEGLLREAIAAIKAARWKIITFPFGVDFVVLDDSKKTARMLIEVTQVRRSQPNSLADFETDLWKVMANIMSDAFGEIYCEAVDWDG